MKGCLTINRIAFSLLTCSTCFSRITSAIGRIFSAKYSLVGRCRTRTTRPNVPVPIPSKKVSHNLYTCICIYTKILTRKSTAASESFRALSAYEQKNASLLLLAPEICCWGGIHCGGQTQASDGPANFAPPPHTSHAFTERSVSKGGNRQTLCSSAAVEQSLYSVRANGGMRFRYAIYCMQLQRYCDQLPPLLPIKSIHTSLVFQDRPISIYSSMELYFITLLVMQPAFLCDSFGYLQHCVAFYFISFSLFYSLAALKAVGL